jgi:hypothetical protein
LLWLFWIWGLAVCLGWPQTMILPILASQVARITGVSHWRLAKVNFESNRFMNTIKGGP